MSLLRASVSVRGLEPGPRTKSAILIGAAALTLLALSWHAAERVRSAVLGLDIEPVAAASKAIRLRLSANQSAPAAPVTRSAVLTSEEWLNNLRSEKFWSGRKSSGSGWSPAPKQAPMGLGMWGNPSAQGTGFGRSWGDGSYRTVCVRLCDGYFFPVSAAATSDAFEDDEAKCASRCSSPARLYVYRNGSEEPADMVDLKGQPYSRLRTAFLYRTAYDASCKCKPHPWEEEATDRHRMYALQAETRKGNRKAAAELEVLRKKIAARDGDVDTTRRKSHSGTGRSKQASAKPPKGPVVPAVPAAEDEDTSGAKAAAMAAAEPPRPRHGVKVTRLNGNAASAAPVPVVTPVAPSRVSSREDDWRKRALGLR